MRFRARHLFLAAPSDTPPEVVEAKQRAIEEFSERVAQGEKFEDLIGVASEDEATRTHGGDLDYFSESRMPSDFFAAIKGIRVGQISSVIRTRLGFHLVQLTNAVPTREMEFDQVEAEIRLTLENQKRQVALEELKGELSRPEESIGTPTL
jgi:parvulin-like peptidyl-prolyl isomerase